MSYCNFIKTTTNAKRDIHKKYHDEQYGFPIHDDNELFARLMLEINQAGLSWETILKKEKQFRKAYHNFAIAKVAKYTEKDRERLMNDAGIIRNRLKINAAIENAKVLVKIQKEYGSFKAWLASHHPKTKEEWVKLFKKHFKFTGGEIVNEFLMSIGYLEGAHAKDCPVYAKIYFTKIILGSSSKYRKEVLDNKGYQFEVMSPDIDEKAIRVEDHYQLPLILARAKAEALIPRISEEALVITADQVVVCNGDLHEKPRDEEEVKIFLKKYSKGYPAETVSALVVINTKNGKRAEGVDLAKIYYKPIPDEVIREFIEKGDPFTKAGGFEINSPILHSYEHKTEGAEDSIMGMPLELLERLIEEVK